MIIVTLSVVCTLKGSGRFRGGAPGMPPLWPKIFSISCSFSQNLAKSYVGAPPGGLVPPPMGNPGSTPEGHVETVDTKDQSNAIVY